MNSSVDNLFTLFSHVFLNIIILTKKNLSTQVCGYENVFILVIHILYHQIRKIFCTNIYHIYTVHTYSNSTEVFE